MRQRMLRGGGPPALAVLCAACGLSRRGKCHSVCPQPVWDAVTVHQAATCTLTAALLDCAPACPGQRGHATALSSASVLNGNIAMPPNHFKPHSGLKSVCTCHR